MNINLQDIVVFAGFFAVVIGLSVWKSRRAGRGEGSSDFFLAGRGLTWPLIGISIVAANISTEQMVGMAGQAAGSTGLAVSCWQLLGSVFIVIIAMTLLPKFLRAGIYTMPEYLEYRYNTLTRGIMAVLTVVIYAVVMLPAVLYSGGLTLRAITGMNLTQAVWLIGLIGAGYSTVGGLKAIAWADLVQGLALLAGGLLIFVLGLEKVGGWDKFATVNEAKLHMVLPANNADLPWTGVVGGMWIVMIYYCGLNQFIVQRNLAAKSLKHGQLGMIFAGGLWLLVPFAIVMPGLMAQQLFADRLGKSDAAFPVMVTQLIQPGVRGFIYAAIAGAVTSTLASLLNSASTISTMDVYRRMFRPQATEGSLVWLGRGLTVAFVLAGCAIAPMLDDPKFGGVFQYIQQFQGYIWPGVVAAFVMPFVLPRVPGVAGVAALVTGPLAYAAFQFTEKSAKNPLGIHEIHFLLQVLLAFLIVAAVMVALTAIMPRKEPSRLPVREEISLETEPVVKIAGAAVILGVIAFFIAFW
ncbi:MAG: sodium/solute symporter [Verrucomicrobia bacterium]|nr:sodium/solute symporter [Verrucomicrobiota bacterium]